MITGFRGGALFAAVTLLLCGCVGGHARLVSPPVPSTAAIVQALPDIADTSGQLPQPAGRLIASRSGTGSAPLNLGRAVAVGRRLTVRVICASSGRFVVNATAAAGTKLVLGGGCDAKDVYTGTLVSAAGDRQLAIAIPAGGRWRVAVWQT